GAALVPVGELGRGGHRVGDPGLDVTGQGGRAQLGRGDVHRLVAGPGGGPVTQVAGDRGAGVINRGVLVGDGGVHGHRCPLKTGGGVCQAASSASMVRTAISVRRWVLAWISSTCVRIWRPSAGVVHARVRRWAAPGLSRTSARSENSWSARFCAAANSACSSAPSVSSTFSVSSVSPGWCGAIRLLSSGLVFSG